MIIIVLLAKYSYLLVLLFSAIILLKISDKKHLITLSIITLPLSFLLSRIANKLYLDPRPFVVEHVQPLIPHIPDNGFPSDHTLIVATVAAIVFKFNKKWGTILLILSFISGYMRVLAKVHHFVDIAGSLIIALIATYIASYLLQIVKRGKVSKLTEE